MVALTLIQTAITNSNFEVFKTVLISKMWSFGDWFLWTLPYFAYRYNVDKRYFHARQQQRGQEPVDAAASSTSPAGSRPQNHQPEQDAGKNVVRSTDQTTSGDTNNRIGATRVKSDDASCLIS
jgi:hypothetical protein